MLQTPVLLITFNRPDHVSRVLSVVRDVRPNSLFVFQDGERDGCIEDEQRCREVRSVIQSQVDWECDFRTYYSEINLGCGPGPAAAISWFFENVEQGIILEDDAVPHPEFFQYASVLLNKYKDDSSVRAIGSMNIDTQRWGDGSYYFSMMNRNLCAWATWRRAWLSFDIHMKGISRHQLSRALRYYHCGPLEREYWCHCLDVVHENGCDGKSWDMQFFMSIWLNHGKGVIPNVNLSSNIGTVGEGTHAMAAGNIIDNVPTSPIFPLSSPSSEDVQYEADRQFHFMYFEPYRKNWKWYRIAYVLLNNRIKRLLGHKGPWIRKKP